MFHFLIFYVSIILNSCFVCSLNTAIHELNYNGYIRIATHDGYQKIYLLVDKTPDIGIINTHILTYDLQTTELTPIVTTGVPPKAEVDLGVAFTADGEFEKGDGDFYYFVTSGDLYKFTAGTEQVDVIGRTELPIVFSITPVLPPASDSVYFVAYQRNSPQLILASINVRSGKEAFVTELPPVIGNDTVFTADSNHNLVFFGNDDETGFSLIVFTRNRTSTRHNLKATLPLITLHVDNHQMNSEKLEVDNIDQFCQKEITSVFVNLQGNGTIYSFPGPGRVKGCKTLKIQMCLDARPPKDAVPRDVLEQHDTTLYCILSEFPNPIISWKFLIPGSKMNPVDLNFNNTPLTLSSIGHRDDGVYYCIGETVCGPEVHSFRVIVKSLTRLLKWRDTRQVKPGRNITLSCNPTEDNRPITFTWLKNNVSIVNNYRLFQLPNNSLAILDTHESDDGNYTCIVQTMRDSVNRTVLLTVTENAPDEDDDESTNEFLLQRSVSFPTAEVLTSIVILSICTVVSTYFYFRYKKGLIAKALTPQEINEFKNGLVNSNSNDDILEGFTDGLPYDETFELPFHSFEINRLCILGQGEFGIVYKGSVKLTDKMEAAAFKTIKSCNSEWTKKELKNLLSELKLMIYIGHHVNIIRLMGAYTRQLQDGVAYIALEFCPNGSLERLLRKVKHVEASSLETVGNSGKDYDKNAFVTTAIQCEWALQIAKGMEHLALKKIIHSDLASRNVLVAADLSIRITDFGLSRKLENYANYVKTGGEPLPWRWMAVESLECRNFSSKSDVWSYGVTLWEIFSMGKIPYPGEVWTVEFVRKLKSGESLLPPPDYASEEIFNKIKSCWLLDSDQRPTFKNLVNFFQQISYRQNNIVYMQEGATRVSLL